MRAFTLVLALAATAFAGVVPRSEEATAASSAADVAYTPPAPMGDLKGIDWNEFFECHCPKDNNGDLGVHINQGKWWYQCAYPGGACQWDDLGKLVNAKQTNCPKFSICIPNWLFPKSS